MIRFGWLSFVLLIGALQGAIVALVLLQRRANREANRLLAALIVAFVLRVIPYIIGYAGFYDAYPWLSFAPFALTLAYGPLVYLYVVRLATDRMPAGWWRHFIPAALQLAYYLVVFPQPLAFKNDFDRTLHEPLIDPLETLLTFVSLGAYALAALGRYRDYRTWLGDATGDAARYSLTWLRTFLLLFGITIALNAAFELVSRFVYHLNYFNRFALYAWYTGLVYYLALEGWRSSERTFPQPGATPPALLAPVEPIPTPVPAADVRALGLAWRERVVREGHWRDPELTLAKLAQLMELSTAHISRLTNEGLGQNFNEAINRLRVAAVQDRLRDPSDTRDLLTLALEAGFSSKASFNRSFKAYSDRTPSEFRRAAQGENVADA